MISHKENLKYRFSEPKLSKLKSNNNWFVFIYYYVNGVRKDLRFSDGLNHRKFIQIGDIGLKERKRRENEREIIANEIIFNLKNWIENRVFDVENKAFRLTKNEKKLTDYLDKFIVFKISERLKLKSITQYSTKVNLFKQYLEDRKLSDIVMGDVNKYLYVDYFHFLKEKSPKANWYNDLLNFHRMFFNWLIDIEEVEVKNLVKIIRPLNKEDIIMHKAIPSLLLTESFVQIESYGSNILSIFAQFIFYTLHRPDTLTQLQMKDFDLQRGIVKIPSTKIKTKKSIVLKLHNTIIELIKNYLSTNPVSKDSYLFGYEFVDSVRGKKKNYQLFGSLRSKSSDYTLKFQYFNEKQIVKAYERDSSLNKIFKYGENTLYGYKHSGVVFLREHNWSLESIIQLTGHRDTEIARWYGRDFRPELPDFIDL